MRLAIIDHKDQVIVAWPTPDSAHRDLGDLIAVAVAPHSWQQRKRDRIKQRVKEFCLERQQETVRL